MATEQGTTNEDRTTVEEATDRIRQLNERAIDGARKAGGAYLDAYERTLKSIVDFQERLAGASQVDWIRSAFEAQAEFTREMGNLYASTAREFLKK
jgi:hypothetical protein